MGWEPQRDQCGSFLQASVALGAVAAVQEVKDLLEDFGTLGGFPSHSQTELALLLADVCLAVASFARIVAPAHVLERLDFAALVAVADSTVVLVGKPVGLLASVQAEAVGHSIAAVVWALDRKAAGSVPEERST